MTDEAPIVVTGIGLTLPTGRTQDDFWEALIERKPALGAYCDETIFSRLIRSFGHIPAEVRSEACSRLPHKLRRFAPDFTACAVLAAHDALEQAGSGWKDIRSERRGIYTAQNDSPFPNLSTFTRALEATRSSNGGCLAELAQEALYRRGVDPFAVIKALSNNVLALVSMTLSLRGDCGAFVQGQGAALAALERARFSLTHGYSDLAVVVGAGTYNDALMLTEHFRLGHLSACNKGPVSLCSFDQERDGTILAEGAVALVLERKSDADSRGARPLLEIARVMSIGNYSDAPQPNLQLIERLQALLDDAGTLGAVCAEGKGTPAHDSDEIALLETVLDRIDTPVTSTRPVIGELNAAGPLADIVAAAAMFQHNKIPPIATLLTPTSSRIDFVQRASRPLQGTSILTLHAGFSGFSGATLLRRTSLTQ